MFIRKPGWLKTVALITCVTFIFSDTVRAEFAAASPNNPAPAEAFSAPLEVPAAFGELSRAYRGAGDELVVLIQDAHANFEAQKNISSILGHLLERHGVRWIGVEGAQGYLAASFLSSYPNRGAVETVARQFMQDAKLSGPEYAAVAEHPELLLYGVEEDGLYRQNRAVFIEALDYKGRDEELVAALRNLLLKIAKKIFSPELYELVTRSENFRRENKNLIAYLGHLQDAASRAGLDTARYPQIVTFIELNEIHRALDSEAVQKEVRHLRAALGMKAKEREAGMDEAARLWEKAKGRGLDVSAYRQAALAAKSFELQKKIDVGLFDEIDSLDRALRDRLLRTDEERALEKQFKVLEIAGKIFNFELSRDDAEFFFAHREDFRAGSIRSAFDRHRQAVEWNGGFPAGAENLDQDLARIEKFYALALERDQVLVERTLSEMRARGEKRIALVAGGFHTAGFERALRQRNISFMTFSPAITQIGDPEKQARLYEDSVKQAPEALAGLLAKLYFPQKGGRINDPRYQLSAHKILLDELGLDELKVVLEKGDRSLDLARLIEENPAVGANLVLSLLTSLVDMDENREAFDAAARLRDILSKFPPEEARLVEFFYPFLDADTEIGVGKQGEVLVIGKARTEAPSLVATIEMVREGGDRVHSPRLSNLARKGAVISQIAGQRLIVQMLAPVERELALLRLQAGARPRAAALGSDALPESEAKRKLQALEKKIRPALAREGVNLRVLRSNLEKGIEEVRAARGYQARRNDFDALLGGLDTAVFDLEAADYRAKITSLREELAGLSGGLRASLDEMDPAQRDRYQNLSRRIDRLGLLYDSVVIEGLQKAE
ncbi:MAG: hypothetical protein HY714_02010, partial [Candidatus Omnitrophica bacterium]|nr:hypothetical protein [Candidatus Omnitrophota bacterium]